MRIRKYNNELFEVTLKGIEQPFYVRSYNEALEIAFRIGGMLWMIWSLKRLISMEQIL